MSDSYSQDHYGQHIRSTEEQAARLDPQGREGLLPHALVGERAISKPEFFNLAATENGLMVVKGGMYLGAAVAVTLMVLGFAKMIARWRKGKPESRLDGLPGRVADFITFGMFQRRVAQRRLAGIMHLMIFYGFIVLFIGTAIVSIEYDGTRKLDEMFGTHLAFWHGDFYLAYSVFLDLMGLVFLGGLGIACYRRFVKRPRHLETSVDDLRILGLFALIAITGFLMEGARIALLDEPFRRWSPVGDFTARVLAAIFGTPGPSGFRPWDRSPYFEGGLGTFHNVAWWVHFVLVAGFLAYIPHGKLAHIFTSPLNIFLRTHKPTGKMATPFKLFNWKTDSDWAGECKALVVTLEDGSYLIAEFEFR